MRPKITEYKPGYPRPARPASERFWEKVDKDGPINEFHPELGPCWIWTAFVKKPYGYGLFRAAYGESAQHAHSYAWFLEYGEKSAEELDHLCHTKNCVRPSHLAPVTHKENMNHTDWHCRAISKIGNHYHGH